MSNDLFRNTEGGVTIRPEFGTTARPPVTTKRVPTFQLLGEWLDLVNETSRDSEAARDFSAAHSHDPEFVRLVDSSDQLRDLFDGK